MFSKEEIQSYRDIKAPDELYEKVIQSGSARKRNFKGLAYAAVALAACLTLFFTRAPQKEISVMVNGQSLHKTVEFYDISPATDMRTSPVFSIPIEIDAKQKATISAEGGVLLLPSGNTVTEFTADGATTFSWEFPRSDEFPLYRLKIQSGRETSYIDLTYDDATGMIKATKNK